MRSRSKVCESTRLQRLYSTTIFAGSGRCTPECNALFIGSFCQSISQTQPETNSLIENIMIEAKQSTMQQEQSERDYDELMASLFVLLSHHSLTQCKASLPPIVERLDELCQHTDIELFPQQLKILVKMRQLWQTHLFQQTLASYNH
jgi:hypothetical protein